ncbi:MAG: glycosyltransferase family 39 protein [Chloroflexota bacterium]|nr:glycosyltransferase family 39 protein [Dehalococcoidia bacterium]MDW8254413.1 glycosyltransferase family 39 protein [Chloroflexota bacterium]
MTFPLRPTLAALLLVAAALRFLDLQTAPPGFWYDEGLNGRFARDILAGDLRLFYGDREGLFFYLLAGATVLFGESIFALRWLTAAVGVLTVAALFALGRRLLGTPAGLIAAAGLAVSVWHFGVNRFAERVNLLPLAEIVTVSCLWRALYPKKGENSRLFAVLAGLAGGLTLYTYLASRLFPFVLGGFLLWQLVFDRRTLRERWLVWPTVALVAALVFLPLGLHYLRFPNDFILRPSQVWPYGGLDGGALLGELARQFGVTLMMFPAAGDANWRHNLAGRPAFDAVAAVALGVGLLRVVARPRRASTALVAIWFVVMLLPSVLASDNPHFLRSFGAIPSAWLLAAHGAVWSAALAAVTGIGWRLPAAGGVIWFLVVAGLAVRTYFVEWRVHPEVLAAFEAEIPAGAAAINRLPADLPVYGSAWIRPHPAVEYLLERGRAVRWFSGVDGLALPGNREAAVALFGPAEVAETILQLLGARLETAAVAGADGAPRFRLYRVPPLAPLPARADFGGVLVLEDAAWEVARDGAGLPVAEPGTSVPVTLRFRVLAPPGRPDLAFSLRLTEGGRTLFQDDSSPYFSALWQPGELIFAHYAIEIPSDAAPGVRTVDLAVYERDGRLLEAHGPAGERLGDRVIIGRLKTRSREPLPTGPPAALFDDRVALRSAAFEPEPCPARVCPGTLRLLWEARAPLHDDLAVFVHLAGPDDRPLAQADGPPAGGRFPTSAWAPGEAIAETRRLEPPADLPAGPLRLLVGLYDPRSGVRLALPDGRTAFELPLAP